MGKCEFLFYKKQMSLGMGMPSVYGLDMANSRVEKRFSSLLLSRFQSIHQTPLVLLYKHEGSIDSMHVPIKSNPEIL